MAWNERFVRLVTECRLLHESFLLDTCARYVWRTFATLEPL